MIRHSLREATAFGSHADLFVPEVRQALLRRFFDWVASR